MADGRLTCSLLRRGEDDRERPAADLVEQERLARRTDVLAARGMFRDGMLAARLRTR